MLSRTEGKEGRRKERAMMTCPKKTATSDVRYSLVSKQQVPHILGPFEIGGRSPCPHKVLYGISRNAFMVLAVPP